MNESFQLVVDAININEAYGEFPELDAKMKSFWQNLIPRFNIFKLSKTPVVKKDTDMLKKLFVNLDCEVHLVADKERNAFTIPGRDDIKEHSFMKLMSNRYLGEQYLKLAKIPFQDIKPGSNGKVIFPSQAKSVDKLIIFATWGLLTHLEPEERIAIYLHEIGHWAYAARMVPRQMLMNSVEATGDAVDPASGARVFSYNAQLLANVMMTYLRRYNEYESDLYAYKGGYGEQLKSGLDKLVDRRKNIDWLTRLSDWLNRLASDAMDTADDIGDSYPTVAQRKKQMDYAKKNPEYSRG